MMSCPTCGAIFPEDARFCAADGSGLVPASQSDPLIGRVVDDRYRIVSTIGEGGFGAVYHARHLRIPRDVALKVLWPGGGRAPDHLKRFEYEVQAVVAIDHPNIVRIFDCGHDAEVGAWVAMERLDGVDLGARIRTGPDLNLFEIQGILKAVCEALDAVHRIGLVHRDVKPSNIFLVNDAKRPLGFSVRLLDFGIATAFAQGGPLIGLPAPPPDVSGERVLGTPAIMSPEQIEGRPVDRRADVYALGVVLFNMLTRANLFVGVSAQDVLIQHLMEPPRAPSSEPVGAWVPPELDQLVVRMLAKDASDRPADTQAVLRALERIKPAIDGAWARAHLGESHAPVGLATGPQAPQDQGEETLVDERRFGAPPRVLVVDDEPAIIELISLILRRVGYDVVSAQGGRPAIEMLRHHADYDAVIVDMMMPDIDGIQCIAQARALGYDGPVVVCTTLTRADLGARLAGLSGVSYVDKTRELHRLPELLTDVGVPPALGPTDQPA